MIMTAGDRKKLDEAITSLKTVCWSAGWRIDAVQMAIKLLELAKQDRLMPGEYNPYAPEHLRKLVASGKLWDTNETV
jgi:hypothetical protein